MAYTPKNIEKTTNPPAMLPRDFKEPSTMAKVREYLEFFKPCAACYITALFLYSSLLCLVKLLALCLK